MLYNSRWSDLVQYEIIMRNRRYNRVCNVEIYSDTKVAHSKKKNAMSECVLLMRIAGWQIGKNVLYTIV